MTFMDDVKKRRKAKSKKQKKALHDATNRSLHRYSIPKGKIWRKKIKDK